MLKKFAEQEKLKDHLLYLLKQYDGDKISIEAVEPTSDIMMRIMEAHTEISKNDGSEAASNYVFNVMASYVLLTTQLIVLNEELINTNEQLLEKFED